MTFYPFLSFFFFFCLSEMFVENVKSEKKYCRSLSLPPPRLSGFLGLARPPLLMVRLSLIWDFGTCTTFDAGGAPKWCRLSLPPPHTYGTFFGTCATFDAGGAPKKRCRSPPPPRSSAFLGLARPSGLAMRRSEKTIWRSPPPSCYPLLICAHAGPQISFELCGYLGPTASPPHTHNKNNTLWRKQIYTLTSMRRGFNLVVLSIFKDEVQFTKEKNMW